MPRDLRAEQAVLDDMPPLSKDDAGAEVESPPDTGSLPLYRMPSTMLEERFKKLKDLHPYVLLLHQDDLDDCDWLEHLAFDPVEAASREKIDYRLHVAGELCSGIFSSGLPTSPGKLGELVRSRDFPLIDSNNSADRRRVLLGHIIATKHSGHLVTDPAMDFPKDWRTNHEMVPSANNGHSEDGKTVCLHSLAVHPDFLGKGLGRVLLVSWTQRIKDAGGVDRIALICREKYIRFYENAGFRKVGESACQYGGGGWYDMVMEFGAGGGMDDAEFD